MIEKLRLSDPKEELTRLKSNPSIRTRLENVLSAYEPEKKYGLFPSLLHQISYCRSIEVLKAVEDTHIVLNHGQSGSDLLSLNILNRELQNLSESNQLLEFEVKLRHPVSFVDQPICDQTHSVDWFKKKLDFENVRKYRITDHQYKNDLIACDAYLGSTAQAESAWSFFLAEGSKDHEIKWKIINQIAEKLISDSEKKESFFQKFTKIDLEILKSYSINRTSDSYKRSGNLYSILIPKEDFDSVGYLAMPLGIPAELTQPAETLLGELQNDESAGRYDPIQIRVVANKICSLNLKTFVFPTRLDQELKESIEKIRSLVKEHF